MKTLIINTIIISLYVMASVFAIQWYDWKLAAIIILYITANNFERTQFLNKRFKRKDNHEF